MKKETELSNSEENTICSVSAKELFLKLDLFPLLRKLIY